jgi:hypothetical protein
MHFDQFIEAIRHEMQPEGRAQHMAGMLQPLLAATPADVTLGIWGLIFLTRSCRLEHPILTTTSELVICIIRGSTIYPA